MNLENTFFVHGGLGFLDFWMGMISGNTFCPRRTRRGVEDGFGAGEARWAGRRGAGRGDDDWSGGLGAPIVGRAGGWRGRGGTHKGGTAGEGRGLGEKGRRAPTRGAPTTSLGWRGAVGGVGYQAS